MKAARNSLLCIAATSALLAGCGNGGGPPKHAPRTVRGLTIGLSLPDRSTSSLCLASGVARSLAGSGAHFVAGDDAGAAAHEGDNITALAHHDHAAGIVVAPLSLTPAIRASRVAHGEGVELSSTFAPDPGTAVRVFAGFADARDIDGGAAIGRYLIRALPRGGEIIIVQGIPGQGPSERLDVGLESALRQVPTLRVVARGNGDDDPAQAVDLVRTALALHPHARAIVSYGPAMGAAIAGELQARHRADIVHVSNGADPSTARWLRTPYLRAVRWYSPADLGLVSGQIVREAIEQGRRVVAQPDRPVPQAIRTAADLAGAPIPCFADQLPAVNAALKSQAAP